ncbi:hypothetical protein D9M71_230180 [compost metagenome]
MKIRDYLRSHEALLQPEGRHTRVRLNGMEAVIRNMPELEIRQMLNKAVALMLERLRRNLERSRLRFEENSLEQIGLRVALHNLYLYMMWDEFWPRYRRGVRRLEPDELLRCQVGEQVLLFCQRHYGDDYKTRAMALLGYTPREFMCWEAQRLELRMRTDSPLYRVA